MDAVVILGKRPLFNTSADLRELAFHPISSYRPEIVERSLFRMLG